MAKYAIPFLEVSYTKWKSIVDADTLPVYYVDLGQNGYTVTTGTADFIWHASVSVGDVDDFETGYKPGGSLVIRDEDARDALAANQAGVATQVKDLNGLNLDAAAGASVPAALRHLVWAGVDETAVVRRVLTTQDGRLVTSSAVAAPPGFTPVNEVESGSINGTVDTFFVIPNGAQLVIQRMAAGGESDSAGSKVELYYAPTGNTIGLQLIRTAYVNGNNFEYTLDYKAPALGDNVRAILLRRERLTGGSVEVAGFWDGYH